MDYLLRPLWEALDKVFQTDYLFQGGEIPCRKCAVLALKDCQPLLRVPIRGVIITQSQSHRELVLREIFCHKQAISVFHYQAVGIFPITILLEGVLSESFWGVHFRFHANLRDLPRCVYLPYFDKELSRPNKLYASLGLCFSARIQCIYYHNLKHRIYLSV